MAHDAAEYQDRRRKSMRNALLLVEEAMDILDLAGAPDDIAAQLAMARYRLETCLYPDE
jgi:hypothetical protein